MKSVDVSYCSEYCLATFLFIDCCLIFCTKVLEEQRRERQDQERARIRLLAADPFDREAQAKIAEEIRMENVNQNMQTAMEYSPEAFAEV